MAYKKNFSATETKRFISGQEHRLVKKPSGFDLYLDEAFFYFCENIGSGDLESVMFKRFKVDIELYKSMLEAALGAGLLIDER